MPQIVVILNPEGLRAIERHTFDDLDSCLTKAVEAAFGIEGENDVAFDVSHMVYTRNEAPVQIEVFYTAGEKEYGRKEPFDPTRTQRKLAIAKIRKAFREFRRSHKIAAITPSVWIRPQYDSPFKPGKVVV
jgi:hypothetical protein